MYSTHWLEQKKLQITEWAKELFKKQFLILDTETSGIHGGVDEIVQIAVITSSGDVLLDSLVKPVNPERLMQWGTGGKRPVDVHGLTPQMLSTAPSFPAVYEQLHPLVAGQDVVVFNAAFDRKMIDGDCRRHRLEKLPVKKYHCAMLKYAQYYGKWNPARQDFRWQSLESACAQLQIRLDERAHSALGDCLRTLEVMKHMAGIRDSTPQV